MIQQRTHESSTMSANGDTFRKSVNILCDYFLPYT